MDSCFFSPRIGKGYARGGIFGKKILALGESHYCGSGCADCGECGKHPECSDFTTNVVNWCLDSSVEREGWMNTYLKFERSLVGKETTPLESRKIWDSIAFYNFLQVAMGGAREAGTNQQYRAAAEPFMQVLEELQPDVLIVWGVRLWNNLPNRNWADGSKVAVDGYEVQNGYYTLPSGKKVKVVCVYHPSVGYDWSFWHKVIVNFI